MSNILLEMKDRIATIRINRPDKLNALSLKALSDLAATLDKLRTDDDVRVLILTGAGDKAFIAGMDIADFEGVTPLEQRDVMQATRVYNTLDRFPKPVIAMINGYCLGGGCEIAISCDIRIASDRARFGQPEVNIGIIPGGGATQRLPRLVGEGQALKLILTGELIDAQEAKAIGLVDALVPHGELEERTLELAGKIADKSPVVLRLAKESVKNASRMCLDEGLRHEADLFALVFGTEDREEGVAAFMEKRKPQWKGR